MILLLLLPELMNRCLSFSFKIYLGEDNEIIHDLN